MPPNPFHAPGGGPPAVSHHDSVRPRSSAGMAFDAFKATGFSAPSSASNDSDSQRDVRHTSVSMASSFSIPILQEAPRRHQPLPLYRSDIASSTKTDSSYSDPTAQTHSHNVLAGLGIQGLALGPTQNQELSELGQVNGQVQPLAGVMGAERKTETFRSHETNAHASMHNLGEHKIYPQPGSTTSTAADPSHNLGSQIGPSGLPAMSGCFTYSNTPNTDTMSNLWSPDFAATASASTTPSTDHKPSPDLSLTRNSPPIWLEKKPHYAFAHSDLTKDGFQEPFGGAFKLLGIMNPDQYKMPWGVSQASGVFWICADRS